MEKTKTIDVRDLSIGDYVRVRMCKWDYDDPETLDAKILAIEGDSVGVGYDNSVIVMSAFVDDLQPIPITAEVLEKNGFRKNGEYNEWNIGEWNERPFIGVSIDRQSIRVKHFGSDIFIENKVVYIHQLQHALRLAKVDKEIEL